MTDQETLRHRYLYRYLYTMWQFESLTPYLDVIQRGYERKEIENNVVMVTMGAVRNMNNPPLNSKIYALCEHYFDDT